MYSIKFILYIILKRISDDPEEIRFNFEHSSEKDQRINSQLLKSTKKMQRT